MIGETLRRATAPLDARRSGVRRRAPQPRSSQPAPPSDARRSSSPIRSPRWIETTFGLDDGAGTGRLRPREPRGRSTAPTAAADELAAADRARPRAAAPRRSASTLMRGYRIADPDDGFPVFAFRLHQFFSRGETVYASLEAEADRYVTTQRAAVRPRRPRRRCCSRSRSAGSAARSTTPSDRPRTTVRRRSSSRATLRHDRRRGQRRTASSTSSRTTRGRTTRGRSLDAASRRLAGAARRRRAGQARLPASTCRDRRRVAPDGAPRRGRAAPLTGSRRRSGSACAAASRYGGRQPRDFGKLDDARRRRPQHGDDDPGPSLRSAASAATRRSKPEARKLLSFTDNRQDASLQAGHFNDFVEVGLLRSALYRGRGRGRRRRARARRARPARSSTRSTSDRATTPSTRRSRFAARRTRPSERCATCSATASTATSSAAGGSPRRTSSSAGCSRSTTSRSTSSARPRTSGRTRHPALAQRVAGRPRARSRTSCSTSCAASSRSRSTTSTHDWQEAAASSARASCLVEPWAIDEDERARSTPACCSRRRADARARLPRRRLPVRPRRLRPVPPPADDLRRTPASASTLDDTETVIVDLLEALRVAGLVEQVDEPTDDDGVPGYQLAAVGDALARRRRHARRIHDPIRVPRLPEDGGRTNQFFVDFYRDVAADGQGLEAREHTAQVPSDEREEREERVPRRRSCRSSSARRRWSSASTSPS